MDQKIIFLKSYNGQIFPKILEKELKIKKFNAPQEA